MKRTMRTITLLIGALLVTLSAGIRAQPAERRSAATAAEARAFLDAVNDAVLRLAIDLNRTGWVPGDHRFADS